MSEQSKNTKQPILVLLIVLNILGLIFYYSPLSLYGYWPDTFVLLAVSIVTWLIVKIVDIQFKKTLKALSLINLVIISFTSLSLFRGIVPVYIIPKGHFQDPDVYGYFIKSGAGMTSGCYGQVHYCKQISWLPFLELRVERDRCSELDYNSIIHGT